MYDLIEQVGVTTAFVLLLFCIAIIGATVGYTMKYFFGND